MKPNDKAIEAAFAAAEAHIGNTSQREWLREILTAAYAAQFQSEDYAGLLKDLRTPHGRCLDMRHDAADAIEALLAERDALKAELIDYKDAAASEADFVNEQAERIRELKAERDALAARLAPVEDEELVEIGAKAMARPPFYQWEEMSDTDRQRTKMACRAAIAAIRPHIEAAERERCAKVLEITSDEIRLHAGEMTAQEMRSVLSVLTWRAAAIRRGK